MKNTGNGLEQKELCTQIFAQFASICVIKNEKSDEEEEKDIEFRQNLKSTFKAWLKKKAPQVEGKDKDSFLMFDNKLNITKPNKENQRLI